MTGYRLKVPEMSCSHCEGRIKKALEGLHLSSYSVNLEERFVDVTTEDLNSVIEALADIGYESYQI